MTLRIALISKLRCLKPKPSGRLDVPSVESRKGVPLRTPSTSMTASTTRQSTNLLACWSPTSVRIWSCHMVTRPKSESRFSSRGHPRP